VISRGHDGIISIQLDNGTSSLVRQANNQTMVIPCGAPPSSSPCFCFSLREESKSKSMCGTGNTETETAISKTVLGERERDPNQFLETVSMVTNRCRSKYISSLSPLGQQQQNATKTIQAGVMMMMSEW
jgi:hypothetical protein